MPTITVNHRSGSIYDVTVDDGRGTSHHEVTVWPSDMAEHWMATQRSKWARRLDQLDDYLQIIKEQKR